MCSIYNIFFIQDTPIKILNYPPLHGFIHSTNYKSLSLIFYLKLLLIIPVEYVTSQCIYTSKVLHVSPYCLHNVDYLHVQRCCVTSNYPMHRLQTQTKHRINIKYSSSNHLQQQQSQTLLLALASKELWPVL